MVIDTSALLAILQNEPQRRSFNESIEVADAPLLCAASYGECSMILESRYGAGGVRDLDHLIARAQVTIVPSTRNRPASPVTRFAGMARAVTPPTSISATAFPTRSRVPSAGRCFSRGTTFRRPTSSVTQKYARPFTTTAPNTQPASAASRTTTLESSCPKQARPVIDP